MLQQASRPNAVLTAFLLTDGIANCGEKTCDRIIELVTSQGVVQEAPSDEASIVSEFRSRPKTTQAERYPKNYQEQTCPPS